MHLRKRRVGDKAGDDYTAPRRSAPADPTRAGTARALRFRVPAQRHGEFLRLPRRPSALAQGEGPHHSNGRTHKLVARSMPAPKRRSQPLGFITTRARRRQQDRLQAGHTIPPIDSGRQVSEHRLCCHRESAVAYRFPNSAEQELVKRLRQRYHLCASGPASLAPLISVACWRSCDCTCHEPCPGSIQSMRTWQPRWLLSRRE